MPGVGAGHCSVCTGVLVGSAATVGVTTGWLSVTGAIACAAGAGAGIVCTDAAAVCVVIWVTADWLLVI
jgi:hypothetical protein